MTPDQPDLPIGTRMKKFMRQVCATLAYRAAFAEVDGTLFDHPTGKAIAAAFLIVVPIAELHDENYVMEGERDLVWDASVHVFPYSDRPSG